MAISDNLMLIITLIGEIGEIPKLTKLENKNCEHYTDGKSFEYMVDAINVCQYHPQCMAIYDQYCSNKDFYLCKHGSVKPSKLGSCVYTIGKHLLYNYH